MGEEDDLYLHQRRKLSSTKVNVKVKITYCIAVQFLRGLSVPQSVQGRHHNVHSMKNLEQ